MDVSKNNLEQAIAALRLSRGSHPACCNLEADVDALIAAIDAARYAAPPAAVPEGYALVSVDALRAWGRLDEVRDACRYPLAALDAARRQAVATVTSSNTAMTFSVVKPGFPDGTKLYAAPTAAACDCDWPLLGNCESCAPPAAAVPADNVTPMRQPRADLARLVESINAAVYANGDGLSVTEAIGALELAKLELLKEQEQ